MRRRIPDLREPELDLLCRIVLTSADALDSDRLGPLLVRGSDLLARVERRVEECVDEGRLSKTGFTCQLAESPRNTFESETISVGRYSFKQPKDLTQQWSRPSSKNRKVRSESVIQELRSLGSRSQSLPQRLDAAPEHRLKSHSVCCWPA